MFISIHCGCLPSGALNHFNLIGMSGADQPAPAYPRHYLAARLKQGGSRDLFIHMDSPSSPICSRNVTPLILFNERLERCLQERKVISYVQSNERRMKAKTSETQHTQSKPNSRKMLIIEEPTLQLLNSSPVGLRGKEQSSRYLEGEKSPNRMPYLSNLKESKSQTRGKTLTEQEKERGDRLINHLLSRTPIKNRLQQYEAVKRYHPKQPAPNNHTEDNNKIDDSAYFYAPLLKLIKEKAAIFNSNTLHRPLNSTHFSRRPEPATTSQEKRRPSCLPITKPRRELIRRNRKEEELGPWAEGQQDVM